MLNGGKLNTAAGTEGCPDIMHSNLKLLELLLYRWPGIEHLGGLAKGVAGRTAEECLDKLARVVTLFDEVGQVAQRATIGGCCRQRDECYCS